MEHWTTLWFAAIFASSILISSSLGSKICNDFVDGLLNQMKEDKDFFTEPYEIPVKSFALYDIENAYIYGLNTLHRLHDVEPMNKGYRYLKVYLGAGELILQCGIKRKFLSFGRSANLEARIPFVEIELEVVPENDGTYPAVRAFKVEEVKGLSVKVTGKGLIRDYVLNAFVKVIGHFFRRMIRSGVEDRLQNFLENKFENFTVPVDCLNDTWDSAVIN